MWSDDPAASLIERDHLETWQSGRGALKGVVRVAERDEGYGEVGRRRWFDQLDARTRKRVAKQGGRADQRVVVDARTVACRRLKMLDVLRGLREELRRGADHRMIGRGRLGARRGQHQHARQLRRHLPEIFEDRLRGEDVGDGPVVNLSSHVRELYKEKGGRPKPAALVIVV